MAPLRQRPRSSPSRTCKLGRSSSGATLRTAAMSSPASPLTRACTRTPGPRCARVRTGAKRTHGKAMQKREGGKNFACPSQILRNFVTERSGFPPPPSPTSSQATWALSLNHYCRQNCEFPPSDCSNRQMATASGTTSAPSSPRHQRHPAAARAMRRP